MATLHTFPGGGKNSAKGDVVRMESMYEHTFLVQAVVRTPITYTYIHT